MGIKGLDGPLCRLPNDGGGETVRDVDGFNPALEGTLPVKPSR
jgi:hypothetical protein